MTRAARAGRPSILAFAPNRWHTQWMNRQQLLSRLAQRGWPVTYSTGALSVWDRASEEWHAAPWLTSYAASGGVCVERPGKIPPRWQRFQIYDRLVVKRHAAALRRRARAAGRDAIAYIFHPAFAPYAAALRCRWTVYHPYDLFSLQPGWTDAQASMERRLAASADLVVAGNASILEALGVAGGRCSAVLPNGADAKAFAAGRYLPCPEDLAAVPRPRIGYIGVLNRKVDFTVIAAVARAQPQWHWALVGPVPTNGPGAAECDPQVADGVRACRQMQNVHFLGDKPHTDLPAYAGHMDVNAMCYRSDQGWWQFVSPLKLHEYLAAGCPVVSTDLPFVNGFANVVRVVRGARGWVGSIEAALADGNAAAAAARQRVAFANSWDERVAQLDAALMAMTQPG